MAFQVRCHRCGHWLGEAPAPLEIVGLFKVPKAREVLPEPRATYRCGPCGWANVFVVATSRTTDAPWRMVELKEAGRAG